MLQQSPHKQKRLCKCLLRGRGKANDRPSVASTTQHHVLSTSIVRHNARQAIQTVDLAIVVTVVVDDVVAVVAAVDVVVE